MTDENEFGPWINHDGKGYPADVVKLAWSKGVRSFSITYDLAGRTYTPYEEANDGKLDPNHPGWTWRRKYLFFGPWLSSDPAYSRILKYRFVYPPKAEAKKSASVEMLREIAAGKREPAPENIPEVSAP